MLKGGADLRFVQALLGHANPDTTSGYLGLVREDLKGELSGLHSDWDGPSAARLRSFLWLRVDSDAHICH